MWPNGLPLSCAAAVNGNTIGAEPGAENRPTRARRAAVSAARAGWAVFQINWNTRCHLFVRVNHITQLTSHVPPLSGEKACSHFAEFSVISLQTKRTRIG